MIRTLALFTILPLALVACGSSEKKTAEPADMTVAESTPPANDMAVAPAPTEREAPPPAPPPPPPPEPQPTVVSIDFAKVVKSPLYKKYAKELRGMAEKQYPQLFKCIDPTKTFKSATFYSDIFGDGPDTSDTFVIHGLTKKQLTKCEAKLEAAAKAEGAEVDIATEGAFTTVTTDGEVKYFYWLDDATFMGAPDLETKEQVEALAAKVRGSIAHPRLDALIAKVDRGQPIWFASAGEMSMYGYLGMKKGVELDVALRMSSEQEAQQSHQAATQQLGMMGSMPSLKPVMDNLTLAVDGTDLQVKLAMTVKDIETLVANVQTDPQMQQLLMMITSGMNL
jgi:hypothetical protein